MQFFKTQFNSSTLGMYILDIANFSVQKVFCATSFDMDISICYSQQYYSLEQGVGFELTTANRSELYYAIHIFFTQTDENY